MTDGGFGLRAADADDAAFVSDMLVEAVNWDPHRPALRRERILSDRSTAHYVAGWPRSGDVGVVAIDSGGGPIGAAWLRRFGIEEPGYGFIGPEVPELSVAVVAAWRGRGVGRALIRGLVNRAVEAGVERILLSVERSNPARALYVREGFTPVESGAASDTMVKDLGS